MLKTLKTLKRKNKLESHSGVKTLYIVDYDSDYCKKGGGTGKDAGHIATKVLLLCKMVIVLKVYIYPVNLQWTYILSPLKSAFGRKKK